jgi:hypothetical protein
MDLGTHITSFRGWDLGRHKNWRLWSRQFEEETRMAQELTRVGRATALYSTPQPSLEITEMPTQDTQLIPASSMTI